MTALSVSSVNSVVFVIFYFDKAFVCVQKEEIVGSCVSDRQSLTICHVKIVAKNCEKICGPIIIQN